MHRPWPTNNVQTTSSVACPHRLWTSQRLANVGCGLLLGLWPAYNGEPTWSMAFLHIFWAAQNKQPMCPAYKGQPKSANDKRNQQGDITQGMPALVEVSTHYSADVGLDFLDGS